MLFGSIASVEDHGYLVDVGIKSINAFLKHDAVRETAQDRNQGKIITLHHHTTTSYNKT